MRRRATHTAHCTQHNEEKSSSECDIMYLRNVNNREHASTHETRSQTHIVKIRQWQPMKISIEQN